MAREARPGGLTRIPSSYRRMTMTAKATSGVCAKASPRASAASDRQLAELAKAIGHPARIRILRLLSAQDTCVAGAIVERLPLSQSTVSQHLKVLREAGLVSACADGPRMCYCIDPRALARLQALMAGLSATCCKEPA